MHALFSLLRKLTISNRLMFGYLLLFLLVLNMANLASYILMRDMVKQGVEQKLTLSTESITNNIATTANVTIRNYLRSISELNLQYVKQQYQRYQQGDITEQQAKDNIAEHLTSQVIGVTGYPYIVDSAGIIRVHPQAELMDVSLMKYSFIEEQIERRSGYLEYEWKNPGETTERSKALHMVYFEPWDWIITSSSYRDEFISLINIGDFNEFISTLRFDETGYAYVVNIEGDFIVHPFFQGNFYHTRDSEGKLFVQDILRGKNGTITYTWKNPQEPDFREKIAVFRFIPEFNWYVVASTYVEELYQPLRELALVHGLILLLSVIIIVPSTILLSRSIVVPLKQVMNQVKRASKGNYTIRIEEQANSDDELAQLSRYFNQFLTKLEQSNQQLYGEIQERVDAQQKQLELNTQLEQLNENLELTIAERTLALEQSMQQLQDTQEQLIESAKLSALGGLVAGVAHEVNTPLGIAVTSTSLIVDINRQLSKAFEEKSLTSEQFAECIQQQTQAIQLLDTNLNRASKLVQDFKQTAVDQVSENRSNFAVFQVLDALIASLHPETRKVPVEPKLIGDESLVMSSLPGVLTQVFSNLILNSVNHAFDAHEQPQITIEFTLDNSNVVFCYRDNGCGVSADLHQKIFEPFFTSKKGKGNTGLGLNLAFNLVTQKLKGNLEFRSDEGVEFIITVPKTLPEDDAEVVSMKEWTSNR